MNRRARVDEAMEHHPTAWRPRPSALQTRMAELLRSEGAGHPEMGARALAARGSLRLDRRSFAALLDVEESTVEALEAGNLAVEHLPRALRILLSGAQSQAPRTGPMWNP